MKLCGQGHPAHKPRSWNSYLGVFPKPALPASSPSSPKLISPCPVISEEAQAQRCEGVCPRPQCIGDKADYTPGSADPQPRALCATLDPASRPAHPGTLSPEARRLVGLFSFPARTAAGPSQPPPLLLFCW